MVIQIVKNILAILILVVFILASYFFLVLQGDTTKLPWATETQEEKSMVVVEKLSTELSKLETVTINASFFESPEFLGLVKNFYEPLPELTGEKANPFF
jgi:beta-lactamase regulating signal transducer with metallopeptidase domain